MNTRIKATGFSITPVIQKYLDARLATLEKLLARDADVARCEVELGRDAGGQRHGEHIWFAEITIKVPGGAQVRATNRAASINAAIDDVKEEAERQLRKEKKSKVTGKRKGGAKAKRLLRGE